MRYRGLVLAFPLVLLIVTPVLAEDDPRVSLSTSVNYSVGDYGTGKDTTIVYVPFTLGVRPIDQLWLSLTVPYLYQNSQKVVVTGGGVYPINNDVNISIDSSDWDYSTEPHPDAWVGVVNNTGPADVYFHVDAICVAATDIIGF